MAFRLKGCRICWVYRALCRAVCAFVGWLQGSIRLHLGVVEGSRFSYG